MKIKNASMSKTVKWQFANKKRAVNDYPFHSDDVTPKARSVEDETSFKSSPDD